MYSYRGELLPNRTYSDSLRAAYAMATDAGHWDIKMLLRMISDRRFDAMDVTWPNADKLLQEVTDCVRQVNFCVFSIIYVYIRILSCIYVHKRLLRNVLYSITYVYTRLLSIIYVDLRLLQKFSATTLTTRDTELWSRDVLALMVEYLQDPDFTNDIDWKGCSDKQLGKFSTLSSGDWYREVQVMYS